MAKKYYWLKLQDSFFSSREVKKLRSIAGGDTFTIIYLKMQLHSIKNGGTICFEGTENNLAEQLSIELDEDIENVKLTLNFLFNNRLVEQIESDEYLLNKVPALIGKETDAAERMRKLRERNIVTPLLQDVTQRKEKREKKEEIEKEIEIDRRDRYEGVPTELLEPLKDFEEMRKKIKAPLTDKARAMLLTKLNKLANGNIQTSIDILNQSTMNCWKSIYELKQYKPQEKKPISFMDL